jgi:NAD(P) transhydrogenase subunit alpha
MKIGLLKEKGIDNRVALLPENVQSLKKLKLDVAVEESAGKGAFFSDDEYKEAGAEIMSNSAVMKQADLLVRINPFSREEITDLSSNQVLVSLLNVYANKEVIKSARDKQLTTFGLDKIPRITRAQSMDVLSSMATTAGYKAVLEAANLLPRFFPMFMSAAGTIKPAKVLILGAGVAGLQAIATSRRLGAVVEAFDVRSAVKEEVESLGGKFVEVEGAEEREDAGGYAVEQSEEYKKKQEQLVQEHAQKADVIITTAQIPGKEAPKLVKKETVEKMKPGSVIIDLAASSGGNCELTRDNDKYRHKGVMIVGNSNYPSDLPSDASKMFGNNLMNFFKLIVDESGNLKLDFNDEIVKETCVTHQGEIIDEKIKEIIK